MATTIYKETWNSSNINCNWKSEKLSRYSFVTNLINFNAQGIQLGYGQNGDTIKENASVNLTDYISVETNHSYYFKCENDLEKGVRFICFFNSSKIFISSISFNLGIASSLNGSFSTPSNCSYIRITIYKEAWGKCSLRSGYSDSLVTNSKDMTPLNIIDNKEGNQIYKDLHFEVYVKAEALIKNFVDCFNLKQFQEFPNNPSIYYFGDYVQNSLILNYATKDYYKEIYPNAFSDFIGNHSYIVGDLITGSVYTFSAKYVCIKAHTSATNFGDDYLNSNLVLTGNWAEISSSDSNWLYIDKSIKETNYSKETGFPYVGSLVFKNLWGCDMINYLNTYINKSYFAISYYDLFAGNLRTNNINYDKFFQQGYFSDISLDDDLHVLEGFGVRLIRGEKFKNDNILGDTVLNNYFSFLEQRNPIDSSWSANTDSVNSNYFNNSIDRPFDHWYRFEPTRSIPFFKEKIFEDFLIELVLQREDTLGNLFQRVVDLPLLVTFTNNLIKCYFKNDNLDSSIYTSEYLNSNAVNSFYYNHIEGTSGVSSKITVWCPNVKKLSVSSTIFNPNRVNTFPKLINTNGNTNSSLEGQTCILTWSANELNIGETITAIHSLEYSDGENYDKFIFIEEITRNS